MMQEQQLIGTPTIKKGGLEAWLQRYRNVVIYILIVGVGDLLQLWLFCVVNYFYDRRSIAFADVVADGSLFFYSATLFCSGIWHLITSPNRSARTIMQLLTVLTVLPSSILLIVLYTIETLGLIPMQEMIRGCYAQECEHIKLQEPSIPPHDYMNLQLIIASVAAAFAIATVIWSECGHQPDDTKQTVKINGTT